MKINYYILEKFQTNKNVFPFYNIILILIRANLEHTKIYILQTRVSSSVELI